MKNQKIAYGLVALIALALIGIIYWGVSQPLAAVGTTQIENLNSDFENLNSEESYLEIEKVNIEIPDLKSKFEGIGNPFAGINLPECYYGTC